MKKGNLNAKPSLAQASEEELLWACKALDAVAEALDRVAAQPKLAPKLAVELLKKTPTILEALLLITVPECRVVLYDLSKSALNLVRALAKEEMKKKKERESKE